MFEVNEAENAIVVAAVLHFARHDRHSGSGGSEFHDHFTKLEMNAGQVWALSPDQTQATIMRAKKSSICHAVFQHEPYVSCGSTLT